jgi:hypothetical protein
MKKILFFVLLFLPGIVFSQDYMDDIAEKSCLCLSEIPDTLEEQRYLMEIGLCMIHASMPYKKQIKKDYKINLDRIDIEGEKLGSIIGLRMASFCPMALLKMSERNTVEKEPVSEGKSLQGVVSKIEKDYFVIISLRDDTGKTTKLYWLTFVDSNLELEDEYDQIVGKSVEISYESKEFFDPKIGQYRQFNVIRNLFLYGQ